jgi:hypothetical protein
VKDLSAHIRDLLSLHSRPAETARTSRRNGHNRDLAIYARDSDAAQSRIEADPERAAWPEDARLTYLERLAIGDELGMDTSPGAEAEQIARGEARQVAAGIPVDFGSGRNAALIDQLLSAFASMPLTYVGSESRLPELPAGPGAPS